MHDTFIIHPPPPPPFFSPLHLDLFQQAAGGKVGLEYRSCTQLLEDLILVSIASDDTAVAYGDGTAQNHVGMLFFWGPSDPQAPHGRGNIPLW